MVSSGAPRGSSSTAACSRGGATFPLDLDDAVASAELIDAVYRASGLGPRPRHEPVRA